MIITPIDHGLDYIGKSRGLRAGGVHMSDLYNSLFKALEPKRYNSDTPMNPLHLEMGLAWEDMLEDGLKDRLMEVAGEDISRPGEFRTDGGVSFNPDLLIYADDEPVRLGEIKLTWMSSRDMPTEVTNALPPKFRKWEVQMMAYCYHLDLHLARLYSFHVNGEYAWMRKKTASNARAIVAQTDTPGGPQLRAFDIVYEQWELDENWQMLLNHGQHVGLLDAHGRALPQ